MQGLQGACKVARLMGVRQPAQGSRFPAGCSMPCHGVSCVGLEVMRARGQTCEEPQGVFDHVVGATLMVWGVAGWAVGVTHT